MYFFSDTSLSFSTATAVGSWNVAGYQQINLHAWVKGGSGSVYLVAHFNNLLAYQERLTIGPVGPGGWNIAILTKSYPVHAPTLTVTLSDPPTPTEFKLRLYAACCEAPGGLIGRLLWPKQTIEGDLQRKLSEPIDLDALARVSPPAEAGP